MHWKSMPLNCTYKIIFWSPNCVLDSTSILAGEKGSRGSVCPLKGSAEDHGTWTGKDILD